MYGGTDSSSSQSINPFTNSGGATGIGAASFYFGGNPSAAMVLGGVNSKWLYIAVAAAAVFLLVRGKL